MNPFTIALDSIWHHKTRSLLTALGVVIGVFAVVTLLALGNGMRSYVAGQFSSFGVDLVTIRPALPGSAGGRAGFGPRGMGFGQAPSTLTLEDANAISGLKNAHVDAVTPVANLPAVVQRGARTAPGTAVVGTTGSFFPIQRIRFAKGHFAAPTSKEIVLGAGVATRLFQGTSPVGKSVHLNNQTFHVVGVLAKTGALLGVDPDHTAYLDIRTALSMGSGSTLSEILVKANSNSWVNRVQREVTRLMDIRHPQKDFQIITSSQMLSTIQNTLSVITAVLGGIASISLVVGGIGIMNIMLVTVTERFREIGIRKAMGARNSDILAQFLVESILLALVGGIIGILLSTVTSFIVARSLGIPVPIDLTTVLLALAFSALVGSIFGVLPAWRAARLVPVQALRTD